MPKSIQILLTELNRLETRRRATLEQLARAEPLVAGSLTIIRRSCGKTNCHCAQKDDSGHPTPVLMSTVANQRRCQVIRRADLERVQARVDRYRLFREGLRTLKHLESEMNAKLRELMAFLDEGYS